MSEFSWIVGFCCHSHVFLNTSYLSYNNFSFKSVIEDTETSVNRLVMNTHTHNTHTHTHRHTPIPDCLWDKMHAPFHNLPGYLKQIQLGPKWFFCMFFKIQPYWTCLVSLKASCSVVLLGFGLSFSSFWGPFQTLSPCPSSLTANPYPGLMAALSLRGLPHLLNWVVTPVADFFSTLVLTLLAFYEMFLTTFWQSCISVSSIHSIIVHPAVSSSLLPSDTGLNWRKPSLRQEAQPKSTLLLDSWIFHLTASNLSHGRGRQGQSGWSSCLCPCFLSRLKYFSGLGYRSGEYRGC